jgi:hypothetical protein
MRVRTCLLHYLPMPPKAGFNVTGVGRPARRYGTLGLDLVDDLVESSYSSQGVEPCARYVAPLDGITV